MDRDVELPRIRELERIERGCLSALLALDGNLLFPPHNPQPLYLKRRWVFDNADPVAFGLGIW